ncbi:DUF4184 family protein [Microbacterium hominis]|uniref:DUF4184 domain-containing protein n=1 Tax=Microbacterium hominis TaxID=162426 RepID=A0A2K9DB70_9MICO|nr:MULTISPECIES: DUF4184 family protein [Microbacterium]AUG30142.1 DUF4184 domain-containing protein [Microbacterium hominis]QRY41446.1 DUF4184 family protein [Microbacterium hominis]
MPFTVSHAVVALPFVRTPLLPAAIAIGAMTPDLPLFVRGTPVSYQLTHTNLAVSTLIAAGLTVLWYLLLRPAVRALSPTWLAARLPAEWDRVGIPAWWSRRPAWASALLAALSLLLGVASHIAWDAFTHEGRWGTTLFPALDERWGPLLGLKWLQYGSSAFGLIVLAVAAFLWLRRRPPSTPATGIPAAVRWSWWLSLPLVLVCAWAIGVVVHGPFTSAWTVQHLAYRVLPPACAVWGAATLVLCIAIAVRRRRAA